MWPALGPLPQRHQVVLKGGGLGWHPSCLPSWLSPQSLLGHLQSHAFPWEFSLLYFLPMNVREVKPDRVVIVLAL